MENTKINIENIKSRIEIVNKIIEKIASLDRKFFEHNGRVAHIFNANEILFMRSEYDLIDINITNIDYRPYEFNSGGTIWGLTKDFRDFILSGEKSNGENGYGGLYCSHWGYRTESMKAIQKFAESLGYL